VGYTLKYTYIQLYTEREKERDIDIDVMVNGIPKALRTGLLGLSPIEVYSADLLRLSI
jgi:hypothetical protein